MIEAPQKFIFFLMHLCYNSNYNFLSDSLQSMEGEAGKIVDKICVSSNSSLSDYDSDDEMSS